MRRAGKKGIQLVAMLLLIVIGITSIPVSVKAAEQRKDIPLPILCYANSDGRVTTYRSVNGKYSGYIDGAVDKVVILEAYNAEKSEETWCKVRYPIGNGKYKNAYTTASNLFSTMNFSLEKMQLGSKKTVYRKSDMKKSFGTVYADDDVIIIGTSGNNTQIIYPISGGYKMGWISGTYQSKKEEENKVQETELISGYYQIKTALNKESVLDIYGVYTSNGANLQLCSNNYGLNQAFLVKKESDGYYSFTPLHARGQRLDVENNGMTSGTNIIQWQATGGDNQKWKIVETSDGYYSIISKLNGLYMDVSGASTADETNIQCYEGNGTLAQKFIFHEAKLNGKRYCETEEGKKEIEQTASKEENNTSEKLLSLDTDITVEELCFNHIYYADKYSDLKKVYGYDRTLLLSHWKQHGIREGRSASPILDLTHYLQNNKDLQKAFGKDYTQVYNHFLAHGYKEFRNSSPYYNGETYRNNYKDLKPYDSFSLLYHYCQYGIGEGRQAGEKKYTGNWDYSVCESSSSERKAVVAYMKSMATIEWTPSKTFKHWSGGNRYWYAGTTYRGIPYSQSMRTATLEKFKDNMSGKTYIGKATQSTYMGSDCSSAVAMAYSIVNPRIKPAEISTYVLYPKSGYTRKVGEYYYNDSNNSESIISDNTKAIMLQSYAKLQIGDLVVRDCPRYENGKDVGPHHVMMVTEVGDNYVKVTHQTEYLVELRTSWRVDEKYTFERLYKEKYVPVTLISW